MSDYQLEIKQIVDYPRCRVYREFVQSLISDRNIRTNGSSGLFHYTVLCSYANFRTSYRRLDGISYTVYPGEWVCRLSELVECLRLCTRRQALQILEKLQEQNFIQYSILGRGHLVKYRIKGWRRHNTVLDYNCPCQKETGFFFLPISIANELISVERCSEMDIILDLWLSAVYNDTQVQGSFAGPVAYFRNGSGCPLISYADLSQRWGISKATVGRVLKKLTKEGYISMLTFPGRHGTAIYLQNYLSTMFQVSDVMVVEVDKYGNIQNYMVDTDPTRPMELSVYSNYDDEPEEEMDTGLQIVKYEAGTTIPLSGAMFEVVGPDGATVGTFTTNSSGKIRIPLTLIGNYTVYERVAPEFYLLSEEPAQNVQVVYGEVAEVVFENEPYGNLRIEKTTNTGMNLPGAMVTVTHIESGKTYSAETNSAGVAMFNKVKPGAYRIQETAAPSGWLLNDTIYTTNVVAGETTTFHLTNEELPGLRIIKYDRKFMVAMPDVTFEVWRDGVSLGTFRTDEFGEILLTDVEPGTYRAVEVDTGSDGHILNTTPQEVELEAGDGIKELMFFNDVKPGLRLVKVDSADPSKVIPNVLFEIKSVAGDYGPEEFRTDENGEIDLSKLPAGAYVVTELSCPGYVIDEAQRIIQLDPNEDAQFVFTNSIKPSLQIIKLSSDGSTLEGVTFRIAKIEDGTHYLDRTTNKNGEILVSDLEPGVYSVRETSTVSDHIIDLREYKVELFPGKTSTLVIENQIRPNLYVYKHDADTGEPIPDTVFIVRAADGHSVDEIRTGTDGRAELKNLLPGVYEISEKYVPSPYLLDAPSQLVTLYPNRDHTVYFENHQKPSLTVNKICSVTGEPLKGAKFHVTYASNDTESGEINDLGYFYSDADGQFKLSNLKDGWYKITEVESVPGYRIKDPAAQEVFVKAGESKTVTFENTPLSALVVFKFDSVTGEAVKNAVFQVKYLTGTSGTGGTVIGTYKTSANGSFTVTGLDEGTYIVEELASDSGHVIDTAPQTAYISGKDQDVVELYFGNSPKGALLIKKIDSVSREPLSDVEFFVTTSDGTVVGNANGKFVTDSAGTVLIENIDPGTTLVVKETRTKDNTYILDDTPQTARIKAGQTVTLEFRNQPKGNLIINKQDSVTKEPLEGVQFKITYADGRVVDTDGGQLSSNGLYWTNKEGIIKIDGITGSIVVSEVQSIPGYTIHEETRTQTVVVNTNDTQSLYFYNDPIGGVEIIKVNADKKTERIPNVKFEIRRADDGLVDTVTTDKNGRAFLSLEDGHYYAVEIEGADGFELDNTPHYFEVKNGKTTTLTVENKSLSGILIHKIDSTTGEGIYGVTFLFYDSNKNPIGQYESDQDGWVYITGLTESGRYYIRELENEGYNVDTQMKTVYVRAGKTIEIEWENEPITGQIQIYKYAGEYNEITGTAPGTPLKGAVYEIINARSGKVVDYITTDSRGVAASKPLPLTCYQIREVKAPAYWQLDSTVHDVTLEYAGQIIKLSAYDKPSSLGVSITKRGNAEVMAGNGRCKVGRYGARSGLQYLIGPANMTNHRISIDGVPRFERNEVRICSAGNILERQPIGTRRNDHVTMFACHDILHSRSERVVLCCIGCSICRTTKGEHQDKR